MEKELLARPGLVDCDLERRLLQRRHYWRMKGA